MARYPQARNGTDLLIRDRALEFSYWPMRRGDRRHGLQSRVFASDPWNVIESAIRERTQRQYKNRALASLEQAIDFHNASLIGTVRAARPLLLYYCFMNVVKAFSAMKGLEADFDDFHHGLSSDFPQRHGNMVSGSLKCFPHQPGNAPNRVNVFDLLHQGVIGYSLIQNNPGPNQNHRVMRIKDLLPQILLGHRLWASAASRRERFIEVDRLRILDDRPTSQCWTVFELVSNEFTRHGYSHTELYDGARLQNSWRRTEFLAGEKPDEKARLRIELTAPETYGHRPSDVLNNLMNRVRHDFWRSVTTSKPFRKYYVYISEQNDWVVPQVCSIYMLMFYLGSITRYRPEQFDTLATGKFGAFIEEFIENQPNQWLYMMASEFAEQEVTRAATV